MVAQGQSNLAGREKRMRCRLDYQAIPVAGFAAPSDRHLTGEQIVQDPPDGLR
jgi:hypothetical protein